MIKLLFEELEKEINILNYYQGEAAKRGDLDADVVQTDAGSIDVLFYHIRKAVTDILLLVNSNRVKMTCDYTTDALNFDISPLIKGREYLLDVLKDAIRQYIVYEVRRMWMMLVRPEWADALIRNELVDNIKRALDKVGGGVHVRRRATDLAGI